MRSDTYCLLGITMEGMLNCFRCSLPNIDLFVDLYDAKKDSFVVGMASPDARVGIFSFARYDPSFEERLTGEVNSPGKKKSKKKQHTERELLLLQRSCKVAALWSLNELIFEAGGSP